MHASAAAKDSGQCYERLEFLGDAVLDFQVIRYYYTKYHDAPPGAITLIKDASVNNQILGAMAVHLGLGEFLIHNSAALAGEIERASFGFGQPQLQTVAERALVTAESGRSVAPG